MNENLKCLILYWFFPLVFINCSTSINKDYELESVLDLNYGYLRFTNSIEDGHLIIDTKIFKESRKCHSDYNCSLEDNIKKRANLNSSNPAFAIQMKVGEYFAITKLQYGEMSFFNCKISNFTIYHGFSFKDKYDFNNPVNLYSSDECHFIDEKQAICPSIHITKKGINEIELIQGQIRSKSFAISHLIAPPAVLSAVTLFFCGPLSRDIDFISIKSKQY
ncbi:hypothetical protein [Leptospira meyeri]|uniref:hypothetical protein n=1 Tax=Leptospira meyeri TaxID=29508 RepID=UPI000C2B1A9F|nr:hypothetical protein [Leptospira meyeri]PKA23120.1 hypothetical protein CH381_27385 [Leptospira sp. mixed culture ATI2-C-A1]TGM23354.1 hypothetical protein EHQ73_07085 [Leptospira meyeri]